MMGKYSIKVKLLLCFVLMVVILLLFSTSVLLVRFDSMTKKRIDSEYAEIMIDNKEIIDSVFKTFLARVDFLRFSTNMVELIEADFVSDIESQKQITQLLDNLSLLNVDNGINSDVIYLNKKLDIAENLISYDITEISGYASGSTAAFSSEKVIDKKWFVDAIKNKGVPVVFSKGNLLYHVVAIYENNVYKSDYLAVKVDVINVEYILKHLVKLESYGHEIAILDSDGNVICKSDKNISDLYFKESTKGYNLKSLPCNYGISIASVMPKSMVSVTFMQIKEVLVFYLLASAFVSAILAYILSYMLTKPIIRLSNLMKDTLITDDSETFKYKYSDEIGELYMSFNDMMSRNRNLLNSLNKEIEHRKDVEYELYQHRINPHMMYNTLDSISCRALLDGKNEIAEMNRRLADLYRYSVSGNSFIATLGEEIECVSNYIAIQRYRYERSIVLKVDIDERYCEILLPKCVLQPLVENSIIHGMDCRKKEDFIIEIKAISEDGKCKIYVVDNGKGNDADKINRMLKDSNNIRIGLKNVNNRLKLKYGDNYELRYENNSQDGIIAVLTLPESFGGITE